MNRCACGHWHGVFHCEATIGDESEGSPRCPCPRYRQGAQGSGSRRKAAPGANGRNISQGASAFTSPLYHMKAFSLRNPVVMECIERGWYVDMEERVPDQRDCLTADDLLIGRRLGIAVSYNPWAPLR